MAVYHKRIVIVQILTGLCATYFGLKATLSRIVFDKVGEIICRNDVVQRNNCELLPQEALLNNCSKYQTTDAAKTIYSNVFHSVYY